MVLQNLFKKEKERTKPVTGSSTWQKKSADREIVQAPQGTSLEAYGISYGTMLRRPVISEKASGFGGKGVYAFVVSERANKTNIRRAVETRFGVNVISVRMIRVPPKQVRRGRSVGWKSGYKKALVAVRPGQKIELA